MEIGLNGGMKRRVRLTQDNRLLDVETQIPSPVLDFERGSVILVSAWVAGIISGVDPGARAFPYMRREVLQYFGAGLLPSRPLLVDGCPKQLGAGPEPESELELPPRLLHSWDLLVPRARVPHRATTRPCAPTHLTTVR